VIVALVGTCPYGFERMLKPLDEAAKRRGWDVFMQTGFTAWRPRYSRFDAFVPRVQLMEMLEAAEVVVTHGGYGSIRDSLTCGRPVVAVPRRGDLGEHQDSHQEEIVREFERMGLLIGIEDASSIESAIDRARAFVPAPRQPSRIPALIADYLAKL
jgi:UDP-N-acetylglucosamine transferase subunit ALG13